MDEKPAPNRSPAKRRSRSPDVEATHVGKIARLPYVTRMEINRRLLNGDKGADIIAWLHSLPEVKERLAQYFGGRPISGQNLTNWRISGYAYWLKARGGPEAIIQRLIARTRN